MCLQYGDCHDLTCCSWQHGAQVRHANYKDVESFVFHVVLTTTMLKFKAKFLHMYHSTIAVRPIFWVALCCVGKVCTHKKGRSYRDSWSHCLECATIHFTCHLWVCTSAKAHRPHHLRKDVRDFIHLVDVKEILGVVFTKVSNYDLVFHNPHYLIKGFDVL